MKKRAPGAGRKPQGPFSGLSKKPFSVRMPEAMREELKRAAQESGLADGQELLDRLQRSFDSERQTGRDPTMTQLCFLFVAFAELIHWDRDWRSDPWLYRTIKQGIIKLLDAFQPAGEGEMPELWRRFRDEALPGLFPATKKERERITRSPEAMAEHMVRLVLLDVIRPVPRHKRWEPYLAKLPKPEMQKWFERHLADLENSYYGTVRARRILLKPNPRRRKS